MNWKKIAVGFSKKIEQDFPGTTVRPTAPGELVKSHAEFFPEANEIVYNYYRPWKLRTLAIAHGLGHLMDYRKNFSGNIAAFHNSDWPRQERRAFLYGWTALTHYDLPVSKKEWTNVHRSVIKDAGLYYSLYTVYLKGKGAGHDTCIQQV